jgi:hypothetical protein
MKSMHGKRPIAPGVGESKRFAHETAEKAAEREHILDCHLDGKLIRELYEDGLLSEDRLAKISYHVTDEGIEERNRNRTGHNVTVAAVAEDKDIERYQRTIVVDGQTDFTGMLRDELAAKHQLPGERVHWLSPDKCGRDGTRGWQPKYDEQGREIRWGRMVLAAMPEHVAQERARVFQDRADHALRSAVEKAKEQREQLIDASGASALRPESQGDVGLQIDRGDGSITTL